jgi:hypothetical protein
MLRQMLNSHNLRKEMLALWDLNPNKPLPADGAPMKRLGALCVYIAPKGTGYKTQRLQALCPHCKQSFALGNLAQHVGLNSVGRRRKSPTCLQIWEGTVHAPL